MVKKLASHRSKPQPTSEESASGATILLVEDEAIIAMATASLLQKSGYTVDTAYNAADAIEKAVSDARINLVLMDIDLSRGMDGTEAANMILSRRELPIIFLTSHSEEEYVKRVEKITRYGYVLKNSGHFVLIQAIKMAMELYRSKRTTEQHLRNSLLANEELEKSQVLLTRIGRLYTTLRKINRIIADSGELDEILQSVCDTFVSTGGYHAAWIALTAPAGHKLRSYSSFNPERLLPPASGSPDTSPPRCAQDALKTLQHHYITRHDETCDACPYIPNPNDRHHKDYPSLTIPLHFQTKKLGWMIVILPARFAGLEDELELLIEISREISMAVAAKGHYKIQPPEKRETVAALRRSGAERSEDPESSSQGAHYLEEELNTLIRNDPAIFQFLQAGSLDGLWYWDLTRRENEWMSPEFWSLFGYRAHEKSHSPAEWQSMIFKEDLGIALENLKRHLEDPAHPYDQVVRYRHRNGSTVWVRCRGIAIRDAQGNPIRMLGAHNDMTAQMRARENLLAQLELSETLMKKLVFQTRNNLQLTSSLIAAKETEAGIDLRDLHARLRSIQMFYQKLYEAEEKLQIRIDELLKEIVESAFSGYMKSEIKVRIDLPELLVESQKAVLIGLIANEFAHMAIRAGFPMRGDDCFSITGETESRATVLRLVVEYDAGLDIDTGEDPFGIDLIELLMRDLHGKLQKHHPGRESYRLVIPLESWLSVQS